MGFLKKFFRNVLREGNAPAAGSSFEQLSEEELEAHLGVARYGSFLLTNAVRPSYDLQIVPAEGYRHDSYVDEQSKTRVPVLMASVSREHLFEVFLDLVEPLGGVVDVVLETSHSQGRRGHNDLYREHIDMPVLKSILYDFEDLLTHDGCTGLAVLNPGVPLEVQFDEHKLLIVYGDELAPFEDVLRTHNIRRDEQMKFITEAEHVHSSNDQYVRLFDELKTQLGMDAGYAWNGY